MTEVRRSGWKRDGGQVKPITLRKSMMHEPSASRAKARVRGEAPVALLLEGALSPDNRRSEGEGAGSGERARAIASFVRESKLGWRGRLSPSASRAKRG